MLASRAKGEDQKDLQSSSRPEQVCSARGIGGQQPTDLLESAIIRHLAEIGIASDEQMATPLLPRSRRTDSLGIVDEKRTFVSKIRSRSSGRKRTFFRSGIRKGLCYLNSKHDHRRYRLLPTIQSLAAETRPEKQKTVLLQDNAAPQTTRLIRQKLQDVRWRRGCCPICQTVLISPHRTATFRSA